MKRIMIILPASKQDAANEWVEDNFGASGKGTFDPSLNPSGRLDAPKTHCMCDWQVTDAEYGLLRDEFDSPVWASRIAEGMPYLDPPRDGKTTGRIFRGIHGLKGRTLEDG